MSAAHSVAEPARELRALVAELSRDVEAVRTRVEDINSRVGEAVEETPGHIFAEEIRALVGESVPDREAIRRAARLAVAEQAWRERLGTMLESRDVVDLLSVTKQRVSALARAHRLIALQQGGRLRFPAWQFAVGDAGARESLASAHRELTETGALSPWAAAGWFQEGHPELEGRDPVAFLRQGGEQARLLEVAGRDASRLAQ